MAITYISFLIESGRNTESYIVRFKDDTFGPDEIQFEHGLSFDPTWIEVIELEPTNMAHIVESYNINPVIYYDGTNLTYKYGLQNNNRTIYLYRKFRSGFYVYYKIHLGRKHSEIR